MDQRVDRQSTTNSAITIVLRLHHMLIEGSVITFYITHKPTIPWFYVKMQGCVVAHVFRRDTEAKQKMNDDWDLLPTHVQPSALSAGRKSSTEVLLSTLLRRSGHHSLPDEPLSMMDDDVSGEPSMWLVMVIHNGCSEVDIVAPSGMDGLLTQCLLASYRNTYSGLLENSKFELTLLRIRRYFITLARSALRFPGGPSLALFTEIREDLAEAEQLVYGLHALLIPESIRRQFTEALATRTTRLPRVAMTMAQQLFRVRLPTGPAPPARVAPPAPAPPPGTKAPTPAEGDKNLASGKRHSRPEGSRSEVVTPTVTTAKAVEATTIPVTTTPVAPKGKPGKAAPKRARQRKRKG
jgi:hypothetical protein